MKTELKQILLIGLGKKTDTPRENLSQSLGYQNKEIPSQRCFSIQYSKV